MVAQNMKILGIVENLRYIYIYMYIYIYIYIYILSFKLTYISTQ